MRIFVTGAAGFLGSHLAELLVRQGHEVAGCDNLMGGDAENVPSGVQFEVADCCDVETMTRLTEGAELVYHCAALATEGFSVFAPTLVTKHVYQNTAGVLAGCVGNGVRRFVFCSSMARYGSGKMPFREDQPPHPVDPYGIAKYAAELLVANVCETHGVEYTVAVPHNIIGPRQKYDDPYRNVASIMVNLMLQGKRPVIYGDGLQKRCFSFVGDCVEPLVRMGCAPDMNGEVFNIGPDDEAVTIRELAQCINELLDTHLEPIFVDQRPREVKYAICSADKARHRLGYEPRVGLRDGLRSMIDWISAKGPRPFDYYLPVEIDSPLLPDTWRQHLL